MAIPTLSSSEGSGSGSDIILRRMARREKARSSSCQTLHPEDAWNTVSARTSRLMQDISKGFDISKGLKYCTTKTLNFRNYIGESALDIAIRKSNDIAVCLLLQRTDIKIGTALLRSLQGNKMGLFEQIWNHPNTDINAQDADGWTALHFATSGRYDFKATELLLQHKDLNINAQDADGWTALHLATSRKNFNVLGLLLQRPDIRVSVKDGNGWTALCIAIDHAIIAFERLQDEQNPMNIASFERDRNQAIEMLKQLLNYASPIDLLCLDWEYMIDMANEVEDIEVSNILNDFLTDRIIHPAEQQLRLESHRKCSTKLRIPNGRQT